MGFVRLRSLCSFVVTLLFVTTICQGNIFEEEESSNIIRCASTDPSETESADRNRLVRSFIDRRRQKAGLTGTSPVNLREDLTKEEEVFLPEETVVVPVCFHVISSRLRRGRFSDEELQLQLDTLNTAFSARSCCDETLSWCEPDSCSLDTGFLFAMAGVDEDGNVVEGVTTPNVADPNACKDTTASALWYHGNVLTSARMKMVLRKGDAKVLNIYFKPLGSILGFATLPWDYENAPNRDGVVINTNSAVGGSIESFNEGDTLTHEIGHWLGLFHTFQGGCADFLGGSAEGILDTPRQASSTSGCPASPIPDTCPFSPGVDPIFNFMDYSHDECLYEFTPMQINIMQASWAAYRGGETRNRPILPLTNGLASDPLTLARKEVQTYRYILEEGTSEITCSTTYEDPITGEPCGRNCRNGDADLFLRFDEVPNVNRGRSDCQRTGPFSNEVCTVRKPAGASELFVSVEADGSFVDILVLCETDM